MFELTEVHPDLPAMPRSFALSRIIGMRNNLASHTSSLTQGEVVAAGDSIKSNVCEAKSALRTVSCSQRQFEPCKQ